GPQNVLELGPLLELVPVRHDEHHRKLAAIADHDRLTHVLVGLDFVLDRLRRDVLSASRDDDVLLAIGDREKTVANLADVAGVEPTLGVDRLGGGGGLVEVAAHHVRAARENLTVGRDHDFDARYRLPDGPDAERGWLIHRDHGRRLGETVPFENRESGRVEKLVDLRSERRAARHEVTELSAGAFLQLRENQSLREAVLGGEESARLAAGELDVGPAFGDVAPPEEDSLFYRAAGKRVLEDARVHLLVQARDREHERRAYFGHVEGNGVVRLGVGDARAGVKHQVMAGHPLEDV